MAEASAAQRRKIFALARERGIDGEELHAYIYMLTKAVSVKELSMAGAVKVIDALEGKQTRRFAPLGQTGACATFAQKGESVRAQGMMSGAQHKLMLALAKEAGLTGENGEASGARLAAFVRERYGIDRQEWIT